jgi:hypothetical protein
VEDADVHEQCGTSSTNGSRYLRHAIGTTAA